MSQQLIDTSTETDTLQAGMEKVNNNFTEVYTALISTGFIVDYLGLAAPSGWLLCNGDTIGDASSSATARANNDTATLFALIWNSVADSEAPVSGGRGATAVADFAAHKRITLPDMRGKVTVGKDASTFVTFGLTLGEETHTLTESELPVISPHVHNSIPTGGTADVSGSVSVDNNGGGSQTSVATTQSAVVTLSGDTSTSSNGGFGAGTAHNNIQPSFVVNKLIKI